MNSGVSVRFDKIACANVAAAASNKMQSQTPRGGGVHHAAGEKLRWVCHLLHRASHSPDGASYLPDGASYLPDGASYLPDEASYLPDGASYLPGEASRLLHEVCHVLDGVRNRAASLPPQRALPAFPADDAEGDDQSDVQEPVRVAIRFAGFPIAPNRWAHVRTPTSTSRWHCA
jgi:hypothetical protein